MSNADSASYSDFDEELRREGLSRYQFVGAIHTLSNDDLAAFGASRKTRTQKLTRVDIEQIQGYLLHAARELHAAANTEGATREKHVAAAAQDARMALNRID